LKSADSVLKTIEFVFGRSGTPGKSVATPARLVLKRLNRAGSRRGGAVDSAEAPSAMDRLAGAGSQFEYGSGEVTPSMGAGSHTRAEERDSHTKSKGAGSTVEHCEREVTPKQERRKSHPSREREVTPRGSGACTEQPAAVKEEPEQRRHGMQRLQRAEFHRKFNSRHPWLSLLRLAESGVEAQSAAGEVELPGIQKVQEAMHFYKRCGGSELRCASIISRPAFTHLLSTAAETPLPGRTDCDASLQPTAAAGRRRCRQPSETSSAPAADSVLSRSPSNLLQVRNSAALTARRRSQQSMRRRQRRRRVQLSVPPPAGPLSSAAASRSTLGRSARSLHRLGPRNPHDGRPPARARRWTRSTCTTPSSATTPRTGSGRWPREAAGGGEPYCYRSATTCATSTGPSRASRTIVCSVIAEPCASSAWCSAATGRSSRTALQHACPPRGQRKRKIKNHPVTLGDALELPDLIKPLTVLSANHRNFFDRLLLTLKHETSCCRIPPRTLWSVMSHSAGSENGHLLGVGQGPPHRPVGRQAASFRHSLEPRQAPAVGGPGRLLREPLGDSGSRTAKHLSPADIPGRAAPFLPADSTFPDNQPPSLPDAGPSTFPADGTSTFSCRCRTAAPSLADAGPSTFPLQMKDPAPSASMKDPAPSLQMKDQHLRLPDPVSLLSAPRTCHAMMSCIFSDGQRLDWRLSRLPSLAFLALLPLPVDFGHPGARCCYYCGSRPNIQFVRLGVFVLPAVMLLVGYIHPLARLQLSTGG
uniref:Non-specific serine/threonine protein kinase n=1 Tax=Macrostomum lignano TaxID=282301 RepID=A0A1I8JQH2_9PLAT